MSHDNSGIQFGIDYQGTVLVGEKLAGENWFLELDQEEFTLVRIHRGNEITTSLEQVKWIAERAPELVKVRDEIEARWIAFKTGVELDLGVTFGAFDCQDGVHQEAPSIFDGLFGGAQ